MWCANPLVAMGRKEELAASPAERKGLEATPDSDLSLGNGRELSPPSLSLPVLSRCSGLPVEAAVA